jgi:hypothetical protein
MTAPMEQFLAMIEGHNSIEVLAVIKGFTEVFSEWIDLERENAVEHSGGVFAADFCEIKDALDSVAAHLDLMEDTLKHCVSVVREMGLLNDQNELTGTGDAVKTGTYLMSVDTNLN